MRRQKVYLDLKCKPLMIAGAVVCIVVLIFSALLLIADVIGRYFLRSSIVGAKELISILMPYIAYLSMGYTMMEHFHIEMTSINEKFKGRHVFINQAVIYLLATAFFILATILGFNSFLDSYRRHELSALGVNLQVWFGKLPIFIGSLIMTIQCALMALAAVINSIRYPFDQNTAEEKEAVK